MIWSILEQTHNTNDPSFSGNMLRSPSEISLVQAECTVFQVSTTDADAVNALYTKFGAGGLATEFKFSLFAVVGALRTGG